MMFRTKSLLTLAAAAVVGISSMANAATVTTSTTAPIQDADDEANLGAATGLLKWFHDVEHDAGQTFTPSANLMLNSYTFQVGRKNDNDHADEWLKFRLGTIDRSGGFDFVDIYEEEAHWDMDWAQGDYVTITLDTPQALAGGVEYGVIPCPADGQLEWSWHSLPQRKRRQQLCRWKCDWPGWSTQSRPYFPYESYCRDRRRWWRP